LPPLLALLALGGLAALAASSLGKRPRRSARTWDVGDLGSGKVSPEETVLMPPLPPGGGPLPLRAWVAWQVVQALQSGSQPLMQATGEALARQGPDGWEGSRYLAVARLAGLTDAPGAGRPPIVGSPPASWQALVRWQIAQSVRTLDPVVMHQTAARVGNLGFPGAASELHRAADDWEDALDSPVIPTSSIAAGMRRNDPKLLRTWAAKLDGMGYRYVAVALRDAASLIETGRMPVV
jgi:hypothetical protein